MKNNFSRTFFRYVFEFTAAGFVGWIYEVATVWVMYRYFDNRGMLHLPIIPIYSVGAFILLALLVFLNDFADKLRDAVVFHGFQIILIGFHFHPPYNGNFGLYPSSANR